MSLAVICNHNYPDLQEFFRSKSNLKKSHIGGQLLFLTNYFAKRGGNICKLPSAFSTKPFFDKFLILDILYAPLLALYLILSGVKIIHFTTSHFSNIPLALIYWLIGKKTMFTIHRFDLDSYDKTRKSLLTLYEKLLFRIAYKIVILSDHERVPLNKKVVIPMAGYKQNIAEPKKNADYFMFFGRIDDYKGLEDIYKLAKDLTNDKFVVAGSGFHNMIKELKELDNVQVLNRFIKDDELMSLFKGAKLVLLPYKSISQSAVQILSYSYATPVVCYDVGNLSEFIINGETGYLLPQNDYAAFKKVVKNFDESKLFELSKKTISYFDSNFSDKVLFKQYEKFYGLLF